MIEKRLQDGWPQLRQSPRQPPDDPQAVPVVRAETNDHDPSVAEDGGKLPFAGQTENERLPPSAVQSRDNLHEGAFGTSGVQVGNTKRNSNGCRGSRHVNAFDGQWCRESNKWMILPPMTTICPRN